MAAKVKALQEWCRRQCDGYRDVNVTNMTSSWKSGMAFCAIIHRYRPDLMDYDSLKKEDVYDNNKLAFDVARDELGIPALLDPEDMVMMTVPDKLCIVTYVAQYYNYFHNKPQAGGPGVQAGVKRQSVHESAPVSKPDDVSPPDAKRVAQQAIINDEPMPIATRENEATSGRRNGTLEDRCQICHTKVYLLERHMTSTGRLYHRHCYRGYQRASSVYRKTPDEKENVTPGSSGSPGSSLKGSNAKAIGDTVTVQKSESRQPYSSVMSTNRATGSPSSSQSPLTSRQPAKSSTEAFGTTSAKSFPNGAGSSQPSTPASLASSAPSSSLSSSSSSALLKSLYTAPSYKSDSVSTGLGTGVTSDVGRSRGTNADVSTGGGQTPVKSSLAFSWAASPSVSRYPVPSSSSVAPTAASSTSVGVSSAVTASTVFGSSPLKFTSATSSTATSVVKSSVGFSSAASPSVSRYPVPSSSSVTSTAASSTSVGVSSAVTASTVFGSSPLKFTSATSSTVTSVVTPKYSGYGLGFTGVGKRTGDAGVAVSSAPSSGGLSFPARPLNGSSAATVASGTASVASASASTSASSSSAAVSTSATRASARLSTIQSNSDNDKPKYTSVIASSSYGSMPRFGSSSVVTTSAVVISTVVASSADNKVPWTFSKPHNASDWTAGQSALTRRAETTSVSLSTPWSSSTRPTSAFEGAKSLSANQSSPVVTRTTVAETASGDLSKGSKTPSEVAGKVSQKDREVVVGLLQTLTNRRNQKLQESPAVCTPSPVYSASNHSPAMQSGFVPNRSGLDVTPKFVAESPRADTTNSSAGTSIAGKQLSSNAYTSSVTNTSSSVKSSWSSAANTLESKTPVAVATSTGTKTEWQLEAERRAAARRGVYVDPEKNPGKVQYSIRTSECIQTPVTASSSAPAAKPAASAADGGVTLVLNVGDYKKPHPQLGVSTVGTWAPAAKRDTGAEEQSGVRQRASAFVALDSDRTWNSVPRDTSGDTMTSVRHQIVRPSHRQIVIAPKITDSSEPAIPVDEILSRLEELDKQLQTLEAEGRELEEKIRSGSDDAMDEDKDSLMGKWFDLIKQKNELVREESYFMYKRRQQELEQLHEELEYQLRCLLEKPDEMKLPEDKRHEEELLSELVETVSLRNAIVDSIEVDRIRYQEEDQRLEAMMAESGLLADSDSKHRVKRNTKLKKKSHTFGEKMGKSDEKVKAKKKLFKFKSMKKSSPSKNTEITSTTWYQNSS